MKPADFAELVRLPAALTVPGDILAGATAAGWPLGWKTSALPVASTCLYWAGMALNDYADRDLDREERPERPIPSGRVTAGQALTVATGLTATGVGIAAAAGGAPALRVALPLAGAVWTYDLWAKQNAAGPAVMATARGLDVLLGTTGGSRVSAVLPVAAVATHTVAVTELSRGEVHGSSPRAGLRAAAGTMAAAAIAAIPGRHWGTPLSPEQHRGAPVPAGRYRASPVSRWAGPALSAGYAATVGGRQLTAARRPDAQTIRTATGSGVRGVMTLQAALAARKGSIAVAAGLLAAGPVAKLAAKVVSPT